MSVSEWFFQLYTSKSGKKTCFINYNVKNDSDSAKNIVETVILVVLYICHVLDM